MGQGGQETGLWPKAGGGQKLAQYLSEHPAALSPKHTHFQALDAEHRLGQGGCAVASGFQRAGSWTSRPGEPNCTASLPALPLSCLPRPPLLAPDQLYL